MRFRDLLEDYCEIEGVPIVRLLNIDVFFAIVSKTKGNKEHTMARYLDRTLTKKLKNNELTAKEILDDLYLWESLEAVEARYDQSEINDLIKNYEAEGHVFKKRNDRNRGEDR